jgi:uncharacterized protein (DUF305 family)
MAKQRLSTNVAMISAVLAIAACSRQDAAQQDTAGSSAVSAQNVDTGTPSMAGMDHSTMSTPAKDADQEFVRMMVDHHEGLIVMSDTAVARNPSTPVRQEATTMKQKQSAEQKTMIDMLKSDYGEDKMAMVLPSNVAMIAEVASKSGAELDRTFREKVIAHHEDALKMISDYEPKFTKPAVRTMAARMKSDQQKEIAKLRSELGQS